MREKEVFAGKGGGNGTKGCFPFLRDKEAGKGLNVSIIRVEKRKSGRGPFLGCQSQEKGGTVCNRLPFPGTVIKVRGAFRGSKGRFKNEKGEGGGWKGLWTVFMYNVEEPGHDREGDQTEKAERP